MDLGSEVRLFSRSSSTLSEVSVTNIDQSCPLVLPEPGQPSEVGWDVLQQAVIEAELGQADQLGAALGDLL